jgi:recombination protein RecA
MSTSKAITSKLRRKKTTKKKTTKKKLTDTPKIKKDALSEYAERIKQSGVVEVLSLSSHDCLAYVPLHISTQSLELDSLLNGKGLPAGRVTELYGPWHIGKSTIMDHCFASVQQMGGVAILLDTEGSRDPAYSAKIGVDINKLRYLEFNEDQLCIENVLTTIYDTIDFWKSKDLPVVIGWDALAGTATRDEIEKRLESNRQPAQAAKVLREACRQIPAKLGNSKIAVIIANHEYENINMGFGGMGKKRETYGGAAIRHLASIRLGLFSAGEWLKRSDGVIIGRVIGVKLIKNRLGTPWGESRLALIAGVGIDNVWSLFKKLKNANIIQVSGSWAAINLDGEILKFQGWQGLADKCKEDSTLFSRLVSVYRGLV